MAGEQARGLGFDPTVRFDGPVDTVVDERLADDLVNVLREALSNVARHAKASRAEVDVIVGADEVRLIVTDNGVGIPGGGGAGDAMRGGRGLRNMRERAARLGGRLAVGPAPAGQGTRLHWCVFLPR